MQAAFAADRWAAVLALRRWQGVLVVGFPQPVVTINQTDDGGGGVHQSNPLGETREPAD